MRKRGGGRERERERGKTLRPRDCMGSCSQHVGGWVCICVYTSIVAWHLYQLYVEARLSQLHNIKIKVLHVNWVRVVVRDGFEFGCA